MRIKGEVSLAYDLTINDDNFHLSLHEYMFNMTGDYSAYEIDQIEIEFMVDYAYKFYAGEMNDLLKEKEDTNRTNK